MTLKAVQTNQAPAAIGPYSQAVIVNNMVYSSGQLPMIAESGELLTGTIEEQTHQVMKNLTAVLEAAGSSLEQVVKTTLFIANMDEFTRINEVYGSYFPVHKPARSTVEVARLPKDAAIEIEAIALLKGE